MSRTMRPFERSLPMQLMLAREAVMQRFRPNLTARGLTDQQWRIIRALNEFDVVEMVDLCRICCLHAASLSRILPNLERDGLIARRTSKSDQRRVIVSLTAKGKRLFDEAAPELEAIYAALAREIGPARLDRIYSLLDEVIGVLAPPKKPARSAAARISAHVRRKKMVEHNG